METWEDIMEENVLRVGKAGQKHEAIQFAFSGEDRGLDFLTQHSQGVNIFPFPATALEEFLADPTE